MSHSMNHMKRIVSIIAIECGSDERESMIGMCDKVINEDPSNFSINAENLDDDIKVIAQTVKDSLVPPEEED